ncbi:DUF4102 domain-containing protein [Sulfitobacter sp. BDSS02]|nr:DUF4102 domain-containing protein [Sulfitobacter sp. BDSS02]MBR9850010.1 integrase arm-type DNA-binding domain-containing protein [Paracoccaceae bacterium]
MAQSNASRRGKALTTAFVQSVSEPGKYHDGSGLGLYLRVEPNGARFWIQRIMVRGRRREIGLGSPPVVRLAEAREQALENKRLARAGGDPIEKRRRQRETLTFREAALKTHSELAPTWKNSKDRAAFLTTLETYIFPRFGNVPLPDVTSSDVRQAILAAREKAPSVAHKLVYRVSAVFKWGIAEGQCADNPSVAHALALPRSTHKPTHMKALPYREVAGCIATVRNSKAWSSTKLALEFLILTASRSGEVRFGRWNEVSGLDAEQSLASDTATWVVPAERMKMKRAHRVPLSKQAQNVLFEAYALKDDSGLIFPSLRGRVLSDMTLSKLLKGLGFDADVHGFRTSFRTWAQEQTNFPREVAEAALAHKVGDVVEQSYARSDVFEKRRKMMAAWASYLATQVPDVVPLKRNQEAS